MHQALHLPTEPHTSPLRRQIPAPHLQAKTLKLSGVERLTQDRVGWGQASETEPTVLTRRAALKSLLHGLCGGGLNAITVLRGMRAHPRWSHTPAKLSRHRSCRCTADPARLTDLSWQTPCECSRYVNTPHLLADECVPRNSRVEDPIPKMWYEEVEPM